jgi:dienelactone hydrolase
MAGLCLLGQNLQLHTLARPLVGAYLHSNPAATPPWNALLQENTPGARPTGIPLFVAQGDQDTLVVPSATQTFVAGACARGDAVTFRLYPGATHGTIANSAVPDVVSFFSQVLAGPRPATTC